MAFLHKAMLTIPNKSMLLQLWLSMLTNYLQFWQFKKSFKQVICNEKVVWEEVVKGTKRIIITWGLNVKHFFPNAPTTLVVEYIVQNKKMMDYQQ